VQSRLLLTSDAARFPLEIFEDIIDRMDKYTLLAAAQVCAAWYPRAMRNLYYTVYIWKRRCFDMLFKQCRASSRVKQWLATTRELRVTDGHSRAVRGRNPRFLHAVPLALGHTMSRVQRLAINGLRGDMHATFYLALSQFSSVESLQLYLCSLNLSQLRRIIYTFPLLTTLILEEIDVVPHDAVSPVVTTSFHSPYDIHLRYLRIKDRAQNSRLIHWIAHSGLCISLEDLVIWGDEESLRESVSALLKSAGSSLTRLESNSVHGDLVQNTALRSLFLHLNGFVYLIAKDPGRGMNNLVNKLHGVLSTVRSDQLEHIEITSSLCWGTTFKFPHMAPALNLKHLGLRALHEAIGQPHFNALKDVNVQIFVGGDSKVEGKDVSRNLEAMFREFLQPWSDRNIIKRITWMAR